MLNRMIPWAVAFATNLFAARVANTTGVDPLTGLAAMPNPAAMWPPHRKHPTFPKHRKGPTADRLVMVGGSHVHFVPKVKLQGGKGLRP